MNQDRSIYIISGKSPMNLPGGLGAYAINLARIFRELGYAVSVLGFSEQADEFQRDGITFIHVHTPFDRLKGLGVGLITPYFLRTLRRKIDADNAGEILVYGMASWNYVGIRLKKALPGRNIKTLVSCFTTHKHELMGHIRGAPIRDYGPGPFIKYGLAYLLDLIFVRGFDRTAIMGADRIIVHYQSTRKILEEDYGAVSPERLRTIPYCVEIYKRISSEQRDKEVLAIGKERPWVVVICRQDPRKGINTFLKAIRILKDQGIDFDCFIVGSGPFLEDNRRLARRLGLGEKVRFLGFVDDIQPFLHGADVYVLPSLEEGSGAISLLEAMKVGAAIVTTRCDGIPEDFTHERNGLLVEMNDHQDMAHQIRRILEDRDLKMRLSRNATRDYNARFKFEGMLRAMTGIVEEL
ncbi:MAG: glycosyltransferase family 4 protein [Desulfobacterales bacterium]|nr:glycosyltransferase family 4 protein [Desulfobacterales bacterium]